ncbi:DUF6702 family protein [Flavobacterium sp. K5-23]|uniref:DUF6702 family protein n=1 Tax=Flavobacterium sp. K5-23 TaxID=2746225 RepID=UPI00200BD73B|nr:DUF6702 family protein [Flavobacterium sp. K5-23]UQD55076.1 hypothetical protein FLAK523_01200 [Flavobacterium sp. K5-23]
MKKAFIITLLAIFSLSLVSFSAHKFYMAIYQVNYAPQKKMLQITSRIFIDDLNKALEKKYKKKLFLGLDKESAEELILLKKYINENFSIKVNGQSKSMNFLSKEIDDDVLICYWSIKEIAKINSLEISNSVLLDWNAEQQNITHINVLGIKKSILFTESSTKEMLKY